MPTRSRRSTKPARQAFELALAAPQVIALRSLQMARAGAEPSARDQREFWKMGIEKALAFNESWFAMSLQAARIQQQFAWAAVRAFWFPWAAALPSVGPRAFGRAGADVLGKGLAPVHRRVVANAKRLGRARR